MLDVHRDTIERWAQRGLLSLYRVGGRTVRVAEADVLALARPINGTRSEVTK
jgi:excisionase family DNA binding protein